MKQDISPTSIGVETPSEVTQLSGFAASRAGKDRAGSIARKARGVRAVRNDLFVRP